MTTGMRHALRLGLAFGGAIALFFIVAVWQASAAAAATITVNSNADPGTTGDSVLTLREAITVVNSQSTAGLSAAEQAQITGTLGTNDTIQFSGPMTITLSGGTLTPTRAVTIDGTTFTVVVDGGCMTDGSGQCTSGGTIIFTVNSGVTATLNALTIRHGNGPGNGGGILNSGTLTLTNCTLDHNSASQGGGGIFSAGPQLMVTNSTFSSNRAGTGGGIYNNSGTLTVTSSTFSGNSAPDAGGGITGLSGPVTVTNSTFVNNTAPNAGGGGIVIATGVTTSVTNSTFAGNGANSGGGIYTDSVSVTLTNNIIAGSTTGGDLGGSRTFTGSNNLIDDPTISNLTGSNNLNPPNALLAPLGNYGGPTQTFALLPGSPAIDAGAAVGSGPAGPPANTVPATDQRGNPRVGTPDIGAFESRGFSLAITGGNNQSAVVTTPFTQPLTILVASKGAFEPVIGGTVTFTVASNAGAQATFGTLAGCTLSNGNLTATCPIASTVSQVCGSGATSGPAACGSLSGTATSPTLTANGTKGGYSASGTTAGAATPANFALTNIGVTTVVNNIGDGTAIITNCAPGNSNACRLRDAITAVNQNAATDTAITFDVTVFPANTAKTIALTSGTLILTTSMTIDGTGSTVIVDGGCTAICGAAPPTGGVTVFQVNAGNVGLTALTIQHGNATPVITHAAPVQSAPASTNGGGILHNGGALTVTNCTITANNAAKGGGIFNNNATLILVNSTVSGNTASTEGGGIYTQAINSTLVVTNSTIAGNMTSGDGGGIGMGEVAGNIVLTNSTVAGNHATNGGGLQIDVGTTAVTLRNTLVATNTATGSGPDVHGTVNGGTNNLLGNGGGMTGLTNGTSGNQVGTSGTPINPLIGTLGSYGGLTQTVPLLPGSPAIDAGATGEGIPTSDQRGKGRVNAPDIGSFESQGFTLALTSGDNQSTVVNTAFTNPLVATVTAKNAVEPVQGGLVTFTVVPVGGAGATLVSSPATIGAGGQASVIATANGVKGTYTVTAAVVAVTGTATFHLTNTAPLVSITVSPAMVSHRVGQTQTYTAMATYADSTTADLTSQVTWTSDATAVATVDASGNATAQTPGTAHITATQGSVTSNQATLTVTPPTGTGITVGPAPSGRPSGTAGGSDGSPSPVPSPAPPTQGGTTPSGPAPNPVPGGR